MAIQMQMMPPGDGLRTSIAVNGRTYSCALGSTIMVPFVDGQKMLFNGWTAASANGSGTTADRPPPTSTYFQPRLPGGDFHDTTLGAIIRWDGWAWRNVLTGAAV